jgi:hypothetical protein
MDISATTGTMPRRTESLHTLWHARLTRGKVVELTFTFPTSPSEAYFDSTSLTYCGVLRYFVHAALLHSSYFDKDIWNGEGETYSVRHINYECLGHWTSSFNQILGVYIALANEHSNTLINAHRPGSISPTRRKNGSVLATLHAQGKTREAVSNIKISGPGSRGTAPPSRYDRYRTFIMVSSGKKRPVLNRLLNSPCAAAQERL